MRFWIIAAMSFALLYGYPARATVIATYDFEDGTVQGWTSFDGASAPLNSPADAFSGTHSLLTTTSSGGAGGPGISLSSVLVPGATYTITGELKLTPGESPSSANFTMKRADPVCSGGTCFDVVGNFGVPVNATGWTEIGGSYLVSNTETDLFLFVELPAASTAESFYLDDVVIDETSLPTTAAPEPTSLMLLAASLVGVGWLRRRRAIS